MKAPKQPKSDGKKERERGKEKNGKEGKHT